MNVRDRVKELRRVKASQLRPNPKNWRVHPAAQADALRGALSEVGFASPLLARELEDGSLQLIDGHLRAETLGDQELPIVILDVTEAEADKLLLSLDPLAGLAEADPGKLDSLLRGVQTASEALAGMFDKMAADAGLYKSGDSESGDSDNSSIAIKSGFEVIITCTDENHQREVYERLQGEGFACRVLTY